MWLCIWKSSMTNWWLSFYHQQMRHSYESQIYYITQCNNLINEIFSDQIKYLLFNHQHDVRGSKQINTMTTIKVDVLTFTKIWLKVNSIKLNSNEISLCFFHSVNNVSFFIFYFCLPNESMGNFSLFSKSFVLIQYSI